MQPSIETFAAGDDHRGAQLGGDVATEVRHRRHVFALLHDGGDERGAELLADPLHAYRSDPRDLTRLAVDRVAAEEGFVVDDHVGRVPATLRFFVGSLSNASANASAA